MNPFDIPAAYAAATDHFPNHTPRPVIGITANWADGALSLLDGYYRSIEAAGGIPLVVPPGDNTDVLLGVLDRVDGLLCEVGHPHHLPLRASSSALLTISSMRLMMPRF